MLVSSHEMLVVSRRPSLTSQILPRVLGEFFCASGLRGVLGRVSMRTQLGSGAVSLKTSETSLGHSF